MKSRLLILVGLCISLVSNAQERQKITLADIYEKNTFSINAVRGFRWMQNGDYYTSLQKNSNTNTHDILEYSVKTGEVVDTLVHGAGLSLEGETNPIAIDSYEFNQSESMILFTTESEKIYRRSSKAVYYVYYLESGKLLLLDEGDKQSYATISPDGNKVAFVRDNNIFYKDLAANKLVQVTKDGKKNKIINGFADWVYEEELYLSKVFYWSPDGSKISFLRFDETDVPVYNMQKWGGLYPNDYQFKYPKAGEKNSVVTAHVYDLTLAKTEEIKIDDKEDIYLARMQWLPDGTSMSITRLNRLQNHLEIFHANLSSGKVNLVYEEKAKTYIGINQVDDLLYLEDGKSFIISSEKSGYKHMYHYSMKGKLINQITEGNWEVTDFKGFDEKEKKLFYVSTEVSSIERQLYSISIDGRKKSRLSAGSGHHTADFSKDFKYYVSTFSNFMAAPKTVLNDSRGKEIKVLAENNTYEEKTARYGFSSTTYFSVPLENGDSLNAYIMKPYDFDESKKYPVLMYVYGGPGSQNVMNKWNSNAWHHLLTQEGYLVVCVDNRGTGGKGRDFKHMTYKSLGKYETKDQIRGAKFIAKLPFVDASRIGIWGWSYGGYMSSLCLMIGNEYFRAAIAVAPVTNWKFYDTIYTERYLQRPQDNRQGYEDYSPVNHVDKLDGSFLLVHGTGDDNVHFQNAVELQNALIKANKQFQSFYYPNRDHGINGGNTRLHLYTMMTNFIKENL